MSPPKTKITVDTSTVDIERVMAALIPIASTVGDVALTEIVAALQRRLPGTFRLPSPYRELGADEVMFLNNAAASADHRDQLRRLYVHKRERRDLFVTEDGKAFGAPGSKQRDRLSILVAPARIMSTEEFEAFCASRRPGC